jgi:hypothetical protein
VQFNAYATRTMSAGLTSSFRTVTVEHELLPLLIDTTS